MFQLVFLGFLLNVNQIICEIHNLEGFVVEGQFSKITNFPYSAFLGASCPGEPWICGASILNQNFILTAAHCIFGCDTNSSDILIRCGSANRNKGSESLASKYVIHKGYSESAMKCDIGLVKLKEPLSFTIKISRVAIMKSPPYKKLGKVAGWGIRYETDTISSVWLRHITQKIMKRKPCEKIVGHLPLGIICGGDKYRKSYVSLGDSGSALVVLGYIQVGVVSFKRISKSIAMYTDVGYYYDWIKENVIKLYCNKI